ncbi:hypothetical protein OS493_036247 [Desmophyllum pertusum]|uniref:ERAP1-like C-terminal domain-containing protein n=1 Tax=Desmophyllum pertusum TaxID=174260 RepID=A0A9X0D2A1_9CNID|nr:hypothetical protein OS493_036247 [Desmophyllum pertusum]
MMDTWTLQMGYPVLNITDSGNGKFKVSQERFLYDRNANVTSKYKSKFNYKWVVPFTYFTNDSAGQTLLNMTSVEIAWDGSGWIKGNAGQTGFYRINYEQKQWDQLTNQLENDHEKFEVTDRAGLIDDAFNLGQPTHWPGVIMSQEICNFAKKKMTWRAGYIKYTVPLNITKYLANEDEYVPWAAIDNNIEFIASIVPQSSPASKYLEKYLHHQVKSQYQKLGFEDTGSFLEKTKRNLVLSIMCSAGEPSCLRNASDYFKKWMEGPDQNPVPANFRSLVYFYVNLAVHETNWDYILKKFGGGFFSIRNVIFGVTSGFATEFELQELQEFNNKYTAGSGARAQQQAAERVMANVQWRKDNEEDVGNWLKDFLKLITYRLIREHFSGFGHFSLTYFRVEMFSGYQFATVLNNVCKLISGKGDGS